MPLVRPSLKESPEPVPAEDAGETTLPGVAPTQGKTG
jgi:hypothetical protein